MHNNGLQRRPLSIRAFPYWSHLHNVVLNNLTAKTTSSGRGSGLFTTQDAPAEAPILISVPKHLVLSVATIWNFAKSDDNVHEVLTAVGDFGKTARGAILIFLLIQHTLSSSNAEGTLGNVNPWTEYIQFLPEHHSLPTSWTEEERDLLKGTSIAPAVKQKLKSINDEFELIRKSTGALKCCKPWWNGVAGRLSIRDYLKVDALYRSRAMDLPGTGLALVPCIDMANHGSGEKTNAHYETDDDGNAVLVLVDGKTPKAGEEIVITYGDEKGACEMLFSYGFIDEDMENALSIFLELSIPEDDPLRLAKISAFETAPGFRIYMYKDKVAWYGPSVWLQCVNEEDGLGMEVELQKDGTKKLKATWKNTAEIQDIVGLQRCMEEDSLWDVFNLRAHVVITERLRLQRTRLEEAEQKLGRVGNTALGSSVRFFTATKLVALEAKLIRDALYQFDYEIGNLWNLPGVQKFLNPESCAASAEGESNSAENSKIEVMEAGSLV